MCFDLKKKLKGYKLLHGVYICLEILSLAQPTSTPRLQSYILYTKLLTHPQYIVH